MNLVVRLLLTLSALGAVPALGAVAIQDPAAIQAVARDYAAAHLDRDLPGRVEVSADRLDPRLRLRRCPSPLEAFTPPGGRLQGATTVGVRCPSGTGWSIYVPVKINVYAQAVVATRALPRGTTLDADDVTVAEREVSRMAQGYMDTPAAVLGQVARRPLSPGQVITPGSLERPRLIARGERVTVRAEVRGISVSMQAEAMEDGAVGDRVRARTLGARRVVEGQVVAPGVIKVTL